MPIVRMPVVLHANYPHANCPHANCPHANSPHANCPSTIFGIMLLSKGERLSYKVFRTKVLVKRFRIQRTKLFCYLLYTLLTLAYLCNIQQK